MSKGIGPQDVANKLHVFSQQKNTILFAGAGVGKRVGFPLWPDLLENIAAELDRRDLKMEAALVRKRINNGSLLAAATVIRTCEELVEAEKYTLFSDQFKDTIITDVDKLEPLVQFPSAGIVTTNYDRSLTIAAAKFRSHQLPINVELGDDTMKGAATRSDLIMARIHGRVEVPQSMLITNEDYQNIYRNKDYLDFVTKLFEHRSILFVGFSFADPAIALVMNIVKDAFSPNYPSRHAALVPSNASTDLLTLLRSVNIDPIIYDESDEHRALWDGFRKHYEFTQRGTPELPLPSIDQTVDALNSSEIHRFLAFAYAQSKQVSSSSGSLSDIIKNGIVIAFLSEQSGRSCQKVTLIEQLRNRLKLSIAEATEIVDKTLDKLIANREIVATSGGVLRLLRVPEDKTITLLDDLSKSLQARMRVIYNLTVTSSAFEKFPKLLEEILLARAWDVGAYYSGASVRPNQHNLLLIIQKINARHFGEQHEDWRKSLSESIRDIFVNPSKSDASKLARLGRAAFAVQLALASPRSAMFQTGVLPDILYFDASIILPAIVSGHPFQHGYQTAVLRLIEANNRHGDSTPRRICHCFLNEIIHHRQLAMEMVDDMKLENIDKLYDLVRYYGASNVNVYISGYSAYRGTIEGKDKSFRQFLDVHAPYSTEKSLEEFLQSKFSIQTAHTNFKSERLTDYNIVFNELKDAYRTLDKGGKPLLIEHEAEQLVALICDIRLGRRPVFVTADALLRRIIGDSERISHLGGSVMSEVGFIGMVDLLIGLKADPEIYTRLLWAMNCRDAEQQLRDYLTSRCVSSYDEALLIQSPELLKRVVAEHPEMLREMGAARGKSLDDVRKTMSYVDRVNSDYMKMHDAAIKAKRDAFGSGSI